MWATTIFYFLLYLNNHSQTLTIVTPLFLDKTELKDQEKGNPFGLINLDNLEGQLKESQANIQKLLAYVKDVNVSSSCGY